MQPLPKIPYQDISGGMMSLPSDAVIPLNAAKKSVNFHYDRTGKAVQRNGTTQLGADVDAGQTCAGLGQFINAAGTLNSLVSVFNKALYFYDESTWQDKGSVSTTAKVRFASFINLMFRVGGGASTKSWDGSAGGIFGSDQLTGAPDGKFVISFKSRLYIAGNSSFPDRLYFSSVVDVDGNITWDTNLQYVDVNPDDGDQITGLTKIGNLMLIFKNRAVYRWNGTATDPEIVIDVGTSSQESIAQAKQMVFYHSPEGFYATDGGYPKEISKPLRDWTDLVSPSFYPSVSAFADDDHYYCNIGSITKDGRTYPNVWYVFTLSNQTQFLYSLKDSFRFMTKYVKLDNTVTYVGGDTDGMVQTLLSGNTDNGSEIEYEYETPERYFDGRANTKRIQEIVAYVENGAGGRFAVKGDDKGYKEVGEIRGRETIMENINVDGKKIKFKFFGTNKEEPVIFEGFEILSAVSDGEPDKTNA